MSEHLKSREIELYHRRQLTATELLEASAHVESCALCREELRAKEQTPVAIKDLRAGFMLEEAEEETHPRYEQFTLYAANQLDDVEREIMDSHLADCSECAGLLQDLQAFIIAEAPGSPSAVNQSERAASWRERFAAFWRSQTNRFSPQYAMMAAAVLLLLLLGAGVWLGLNRRSQEPEVARVNPPSTNEQTPQPAPTAASTLAPAPEATLNSADNINREVSGPQPPAVNSGPPARVAQSTVLLKDGDRTIMMDNQGNLRGLESLDAKEREAVASALTKQKVEAPSMLAALAGGLSVLRGGASEGVSFPILYPVGKVLMTERPTLRWGRLEGATDYVVSVYDRDFRKVAESAPQTATEWTVTTPLQGGRVYTWHVIANRSGQKIKTPEAPAPEAKFMILDDAQSEEIKRAEERYKGSHLVLGTLYAKAGLLDEAEREFEMLLRDNPKSRLAQHLLQSVKTLKNRK